MAALVPLILMERPNSPNPLKLCSKEYEEKAL
jgi:hypothetical protein